MEYKCQNKDCKNKGRIFIIYLEPELGEYWCDKCNDKFLKKEKK